MYICLCKAITDKQLYEAKKQSKSIKDVCKNLGLGSDCGSCIQEAMDIMKNSNTKVSKSDSPKKINNSK